MAHSCGHASPILASIQLFDPDLMELPPAPKRIKNLRNPCLGGMAPSCSRSLYILLLSWE